MSKKQEILKQILDSIMDRSQPLTREQIESAIFKETLLLDKRSLNNWFMLLWKLNYLTQIRPNSYIVNVVESSRLEVK